MHCLHGILYFYIVTRYSYSLLNKTGKILFAWGAYFHSEIPIFTVKMDTRMPLFT